MKRKNIINAILRPSGAVFSYVHHKGNSAMNGVLAVFFVLFFFLAQRANAQESPLRIYFRFDDSEVLSDYLDNAAALSALDSIIAGGSTSLKVTTYS
ncbi:MAG: hypothetical protein IJ222_10165, partial [Bacteroidales bacterium]|nr:hypothetical protein [Bacteroidales bacterium]